MTSDEVVERIFQELRHAEEKHPGYPTDPIHAAAILAEESGELTQACLDFSYAGADIEDAITEAAQCGAMAIRFLLNVHGFKRTTTIERA
jgi:hypothetical protein